jgi:D-amino-acid dehydrogenase
MATIIIIGGGIIGLSSAYYLNATGHNVTVIDKGNLSSGCSYGNAGYICPSHFIPLASPGIVWQGFKWMWNSKSPFYVQPRLNKELIRWGIQFVKSANKKHVVKSAIPLRDIALLSVACYEQWLKSSELKFFYNKTGMLELFQNAANEHHAADVVNDAQKLGLDTVLLDQKQVQELEPDTVLNVKGAIYFKCDNFCDPAELMQNLKSTLLQKGVLFRAEEEVTDFKIENGVVKKIYSSNIITNNRFTHEADCIVMASGSWSGELAKKLHLTMPLVGGRGYSITMPHEKLKLHNACVFTEARVAVTPFNGMVRLGGTMEITSLQSAPRKERVEGIIEGAKKFVPSFNAPVPEMKDVWYGYRPCSADGIPYIGRSQRVKNMVIATGHSMLGLSLGAGTGKLVSELVNEQKTSIELTPFSPERFE